MRRSSTSGADCELAFLTRGAAGAVVVRGDAVHVVSADPQGPVIDTTGAGDQFAAGALYGLTNGYDLALCARLGSRCARRGDLASRTTATSGPEGARRAAAQPVAVTTRR